MKTLVDLDDRLLKAAQKVTGATTKKETLHLALRELLRAHKRSLLGKMIGEYRHPMTLRQLLSLRSRA